MTFESRSKARPYVAHAWRGGKWNNLACFATPEEAALCVARDVAVNGATKPRWPGAADLPAPLAAAEALRQAAAEGLELVKSDNSAGFFGVTFRSDCRHKPYAVRLARGGKQVQLGSFATAEEAALHSARAVATSGRPAKRAKAVAREVQKVIVLDGVAVGC